MANPRIIYFNRWRYGDMFSGVELSYYHPQFPPDYTQGDSPSDVFRSRYGVGSGGGRFNINHTRKYLDFDEGGAELTATLAIGDYSGTALAAEIQAKMRAAGTREYLVVYNETLGKFQIYTAAAPNFTLHWYSGTHKATDISDVCGYSDAADDSGGYVYPSDYRRNYYPWTTLSQDMLTTIDANFAALINHNVQAASTVQIQFADSSDFVTGFGYETLSPLNPPHHFAFFSQLRSKRYWRIAVGDYDNPQGYTQLGPIVLGKYYELNRGPEAPYLFGKNDPSEIVFSDSMNLYVQERPRLDVRQYAFRGLNTSAINEVRSLLKECGIHKPWVLCLDPSSPNTSSLFMRNSELVLPEYDHLDYWNWQANLVEVV